MDGMQLTWIIARQIKFSVDIYDTLIQRSDEKETLFFFLMRHSSQTLRLLMALEVITSTQHKWYKIMIQNVALESRLARIVHCIRNHGNTVDSTRAHVRNIISWTNRLKTISSVPSKYVRDFYTACQVTFSRRFAYDARAIKDMIGGSFVWILQLIGQLDGKHVEGLYSCRRTGERPQGRGFRRGYFNYRRWVYFCLQVQHAVIDCSHY